MVPLISSSQFNADSIQINNSVNVANSAAEGLGLMNDPGWTISNVESPYVKETTQLALVCWQKLSLLNQFAPLFSDFHH